MRIVQSPIWFLWTFVLFASASDDDLLDFDFTDLKEIDWNYETDNSKEIQTKESTEKHTVTFDDDSDLMDENQVHPFDWREKVLRTALSKALTNKAVRQKFIEVMPILRVLTKQQRLALSALITAQINAKKGNELKLEQVRMMFGDDKSLILPIVFDIANLVRNSAKKYIEFDYNLADFGDFSKTKVTFERRNLELSPQELAKEENNEDVGTLPAAAQITHNFDLDGFEEFMSEEVLDPKEINEELEILKMENNIHPQLDDVSLEMEVGNEEEEQSITDPLAINIQLQQDVPTLTLLKLNKNTTKELLADPPVIKKSLKRVRRSARNSKEFVHKLVRSIPFTVNEEDLQRGSAGRTLKLNTTAFASPKETTTRADASPLNSTTTPSTKPPIIITPETLAEDTYEPYQLVEDLALANLNGSEVFIDESENNENDLVSEGKSEPDDEILPTPEELIAGPRYRVKGNKLMPIRSKLTPNKRKRTQLRARPTKDSARNGGGAPSKRCQRFTASMCLKTDDYPIDHIMGSIRRHRNAMAALLAEYNDKPSNALDTSDDFEEYLYGKKRREDNDMQADLCQSIVRYARPQKARSASGEWKYIVNTGQHTQTLRLEKCMNPQESCSYLANSYRSHCAQVYNYHRLLSWDKTRGLHVDIFKVPTCCSCQIDGHRQAFPALDSHADKGFTPVYKGNFYRQPQQHYDYDEEEEIEDDDYNYASQRKQYKHDTRSDVEELSSNNVKSKVPKPTVGSYLSPPVSEAYEEEYIHKYPRDTASLAVQHNPSYSSSKPSNNYYLREQLQNRRPNQFHKDSRSDQDFSPSEQHGEREVNDFGTAFGKDESTHQNRKNIYSVTQIANTGSSGFSDSSTSTITASTGTIRAFTTPITTIRYRRPTPVDTNAHQKPSITATTSIPTTPTPSSSSAAATTGVSTTLPTFTNGTTAVPSYNFPRSRRIFKNQSRIRIPFTIPSTNTGVSGCPETSTTPTIEFEHEDPTTTVTSTSSQQPNIYAVNHNIFKNHYKTKFSLSYTTTPTLSNSSSSYPSPPKRINYSYHPIIDFFEYNKRIIASSTTTTSTTTTTPQPLMISLVTEINSSPSSYVPSTRTYPHRHNKPAPVLNYQKPSSHYGFKFKRQHELQQHKQQQQQLKYRSQQNEHRIGYGAVAAVAAATDGDVISRSSSSSSGVVSNNPKHITNTHLNSAKSLISSTLNAPTSSISSLTDYEPFLESNIWQPVIAQDF